MHKRDAELGTKETHAALQDVDHAWENLKSARPSSAQEALSTHESALDAVFAFKNVVVRRPSWCWTRESASYDLIDASLVKVPDLARSFSEVRAHLAASVAHGKLTSQEEFKAAMAGGDRRGPPGRHTRRPGRRQDRCGRPPGTAAGHHRARQGLGFGTHPLARPGGDGCGQWHAHTRDREPAAGQLRGVLRRR